MLTIAPRCCDYIYGLRCSLFWSFCSLRTSPLLISLRSPSQESANFLTFRLPFILKRTPSFTATMKSMFINAAAVVLLAVAGSAMPTQRSDSCSTTSATTKSSGSDCDRSCMTNIVTKILDSMVAHDPYSLPLATVYRATENSHPAALGFMTAWRTITKACKISLLAIDVQQGTAYFALDISEGNDAVENVLRARIKVVDQKLTELEIFINRGRGDHGFSFSALELPTNYALEMSPPANRTKADRETLEYVGEAIFAVSGNYTVEVSDNCQFTEMGGKIVDTGTYSNGSSTPLSCSMPSTHPSDANARLGLVVDEELGFVLTSGIIPGVVYPYQNVSAFIPDSMPDPQELQVEYLRDMEANGSIPLLYPFRATGDVLELVQFYNGQLQAMQINLYLSGPNMTSAWL